MTNEIPAEYNSPEVKLGDQVLVFVGHSKDGLELAERATVVQREGGGLALKMKVLAIDVVKQRKYVNVDGLDERPYKLAND